MGTNIKPNLSDGPEGDKVDEKSEDLIIEFNDHFDELIEINPDFADKRDQAFQAWIIQKVAGLQLCVGELERRIEILKK